jgi:type VI secretion system protein ImpA
MASSSVLDIDTLLAPLPGDNPAGQDVRYDGTHDAIKEARRSDDALSQGDWVREIKTADWAAVIDMATEALAAKSKDLQIACWLLEALVKRHGFAGLRDGLRLVRELQERFWETLFPAIDDGDLEPRVALLVWLDDKLPASIRLIPLTDSLNGERYSWLQWRESRDVDNLGRRDPAAMAAALADGKITGEQFDKAAEATPVDDYRAWYEELQQTWTEFEALDRLVDARYGREAPGLGGLKAAIQDCQALVADILKKKGGLPPEPTGRGAPVTPEREVVTPPAAASRETVQRPLPPHPTSVIAEGQGAVLSLEPQNRADALHRLAAIAEYFRRTEPHSPVAYLVQRAVRWGEMPLEDWLRDVIHDDNVLAYVRETLGLKDSDATNNASGT